VFSKNQNDKEQNGFAGSLLAEVESKAKLFVHMGIVDPHVGFVGGEQVLVLRTHNLCLANQIVQNVELMQIRWYVCLESVSPHTLSFSHYLETLYLAAGLKPHVYIEYIAFSDNPWVDRKRRDGLLVTTFSATKEKYLPTTVLSGEKAIQTYCQLLRLAKCPEAVSDSSIAVDVTPIASETISSQIPSPRPMLLPFCGLKIDIRVLWQQLQDKDRKTLNNKLEEGIDAAENIVLLMSKQKLKLSGFQIHAPTFIDKDAVDLIIETTLPDEAEDKISIPMHVVPEPQWNEFPLHQIFIDKIRHCLDSGEPWTSWLFERIAYPSGTIKAWDTYLETATSLHQSSKAAFSSVTACKFIDEQEYLRFSKLLWTARKIVMSAYRAAIEFYSLLHPADQNLQHLKETELTVYLDQSLSQAAQADAFYSLLQQLAVICNRGEGKENDTEGDGGREFTSHHIGKNYSEVISLHLKHLIYLLARLPESDAYIRALIDAYHELRFKGHNPSLSVHNVLLDNKYHIYHRDANFIRIARRAAKRIDMLIEVHAELRRDQIVKEIKDYLRDEYRRVVHPEWVYDENGELPPSTTSFRGAYLARITTLINRLDKIKLMSNTEQRAAILLRGVLSSTAKDIRSREDEDELFERNLFLPIWNTGQTNLMFLYPEVLSLLTSIVTKKDAEIVRQDTPTQLAIAFRNPYDDLSLHSEMFPVMEEAYLDLYGSFILKLSDDAIRQIERDAERFRSNVEQVIIVAQASNVSFVGANNDRLAQASIATTAALKSFIRKEMEGFKQSRILDFGEALMPAEKTQLKTWCRDRMWILELNEDFASSRKVAAFLERIYNRLGLSPLQHIVYVGFPDAPQMMEKNSHDFIARSASNTTSVCYWPAIGFPEVISDLPVTYFNLLSFCLRYPGKLSTMVRRIRKRAENLPGLKQVPTLVHIERETVEAVYQAQLRERNTIDYDEIFHQIAAQIYPHKRDASLTELQQSVVRSYIVLFESLKTLVDVGRDVSQKKHDR